MNASDSERKEILEVISALFKLTNKIIPESPFYDYQSSFAQSLLAAVVGEKAEELTTLFCRQSGKTETIARVVCVLMVALPFLMKLSKINAYPLGISIGIFAPVKFQTEMVYDRIRYYFATAEIKRILKQLSIRILTANNDRLLLSNGSSLHLISCTPTSHIEGLTLHLAVIEEAQDIPPGRIEKSIEPMLTMTSGSLVMVGTANTVKSYFWESIQRNKWRDKVNPLRQRHFEMNWEIVREQNPQYRRFLNTKFLERGPGWFESDPFKMSYGCEFILERGQFFSHSQLKRLEDLGHYVARGPYYHSGVSTVIAPTVAGIDWGKAGDSTVVTVIAKYPDFYRIVDWLELSGDDYDSQFTSIIAFLKRFPSLQRVLAETNGVGDPMTDRLKKSAQQGHLKATIHGFLASEGNNSDGYKNLLMDFCHGEKLLIPTDAVSSQSQEYQEFARQLTSVAKEWRGSQLKVRAVKSNEHDDYISSLMIAYWAARQYGSDELLRNFYRDDFA